MNAKSARSPAVADESADAELVGPRRGFFNILKAFLNLNADVKRTQHATQPDHSAQMQPTAHRLYCDVESQNDNTLATKNQNRNEPGKATTDTVVYRPSAKAEHKLSQKTFVPSVATVEKAVSARTYFETYYNSLLNRPSGRFARQVELEAMLHACKNDTERAEMRIEWSKLETQYLRELRAKVGISSFKRIKTIGRGAFGVVQLVQERKSGQVYAMKCLKKQDMLRREQEAHVKAERDALAAASDRGRWITKLEYSFQDTDYLYLVMEHMPGGDLLNLLIDHDIFEEAMAKFYAAEMVLAIEEAHAMGYIHRDIKPDNFLFNGQGHIRLSDFGLSTDLSWEHDAKYYQLQRKNLLRRTGIDVLEGDTIDRRLGQLVNRVMTEEMPTTHQTSWRNDHRRYLAYSCVGTNSYMSPEVITGEGYSWSCDWWSLGIIIFELLYGFPPFSCKTRHATRMKILGYKDTLWFPESKRVSGNAHHFIKGLLCDRHQRLGSPRRPSRSKFQRQSMQQPFSVSQRQEPETECIQDIKNHPWFRGIDWDNLHLANAPFIPRLSSPFDTRYFEEPSRDETLPPTGGKQNEIERARDIMLRDKTHGAAVMQVRKENAFKGYTYRGKRRMPSKPVASLATKTVLEGLEEFHSTDEEPHGRAMSL